MKTSDKSPMNQRLTIRMTWGDWTMLRELQMALRLPTPADTLRTLVRMHWSVERAAVRRLRKDPRANDILEAILKEKPA